MKAKIPDSKLKKFMMSYFDNVFGADLTTVPGDLIDEYGNVVAKNNGIIRFVDEENEERFCIFFRNNWEDGDGKINPLFKTMVSHSPILEFNGYLEYSMKTLFGDYLWRPYFRTWLKKNYGQDFKTFMCDIIPI